jgi:hypothetical protein
MTYVRFLGLFSGEDIVADTAMRALIRFTLATSSLLKSLIHARYVILSIPQRHSLIRLIRKLG